MTLELKHISVSPSPFPPVEDFSLSLSSGAVYAIAGNEASGKGAVFAALTGQCLPSSGEMLFNGHPLRLKSRRAAVTQGIFPVGGPGELAPGFSVLDQLRACPGVPWRKKQAEQAAEEICRRWQIRLDIHAPAEVLPASQRFFAQLIRGMVCGADIFALWEPERLLTNLEIGKASAIARDLAAEGKIILVFTGRADVALTCENWCALLGASPVLSSSDGPRGGKELDAFMETALIPVEKKEMAVGSVALEARNLQGDGVKNISLEARYGEVTVIAGMPGREQKALAEMLAGLQPLKAGRLRLGEKDITGYSVRGRQLCGLGYLPGPGQGMGWAQGCADRENLALRKYFTSALQESGWLKMGDMGRYGDELLEKNRLPEPLTAEDRLFAAFARETDPLPEALILLQPTKGLSSRAAADMWERIYSLRLNRRAVLVITDDLREALARADRVLVLFQGEIAGEFDPGLTSIQELGLFASGERRRGGEDRFDEE